MSYSSNVDRIYAQARHSFLTIIVTVSVELITVFTPMQDKFFFPLKFGSKVCEVFLNPHMTC